MSSGSLVEREQVRSSWRGRHFRVLDLKCCARSAVVAHSWLTLICWIDVPVPSCGGGEGEIMGICRTRFQGTTTWEMTRDRQKLELETTVLQAKFPTSPCSSGSHPRRHLPVQSYMHPNPRLQADRERLVRAPTPSTR